MQGAREDRVFYFVLRSAEYSGRVTAAILLRRM
jgi:hypothetical protein